MRGSICSRASFILASPLAHTQAGLSRRGCRLACASCCEGLAERSDLCMNCVPRHSGFTTCATGLGAEGGRIEAVSSKRRRPCQGTIAHPGGTFMCDPTDPPSHRPHSPPPPRPPSPPPTPCSLWAHNLCDWPWCRRKRSFGRYYLSAGGACDIDDARSCPIQHPLPPTLHIHPPPQNLLYLFIAKVLHKVLHTYGGSAMLLPTVGHGMIAPCGKDKKLGWLPPSNRYCPLEVNQYMS